MSTNLVLHSSIVLKIYLADGKFLKIHTLFNILKAETLSVNTFIKACIRNIILVYYAGLRKTHKQYMVSLHTASLSMTPLQSTGSWSMSHSSNASPRYRVFYLN